MLNVEIEPCFHNYKNGAHAGFILHMTDALQTQSDVDDLEDSLENSNRSMKG